MHMFLIIWILYRFILIIIFPKNVSIIIHNFNFTPVIQRGHPLGSIYLLGNISVTTVDLTSSRQHAFVIVIIIIYTEKVIDITGQALRTTTETNSTDRTVFHKPGYHINIMNSLIQQMIPT